jgi:2-oxoglutarate dehydrogenase E1 component
MYQTIKQHPSVFAGYLKRHSHLIDNTADRLAQLNANHELAKNTYEKQLDWLSGAWNGLDHQDTNPPTTGIAGQDLQALGALLTQIPASFDLNRKIARQLTQKNTMLADGKGIDWALAESLAFATIIKEGKNVRLSGQDVGRGTFSHRHAVWTCQTSGHYHTPLQTCGTGKANIVNSPLSEWAVLSFEYGYTTAAPHDLVLWEAQFGDFANGAQVPIDQFISSGATKWFRLSGLIMLLPHGYEGQGPEHSSARLERFLQLCAEDNMRVVHITTPANYFHALRRQIIHKDRRPLISMSPKYLLRHKACVSDLTEFDKGTQFQPVLSDPDVVSGAIKANDIKHIVLCTGKVFYDLYDARAAKNAYDHAIIRLEEIYPFPTQELATHLATFTKAQSITWAQEEPQNMGAWSFVDRLIEDTCADIKALKNNRPRYAGRPAAASPAVGTLKAHQQQQNQFMSDVFDVT